MNRKEDAFRKMSDAEVLEYAREHGMIDLSGLREDVTMSKRKDILKNYHCWQSKDGKWKVHLPDKTKPSGRRIVERKTQREIEDVIIPITRNRRRIRRFRSCSTSGTMTAPGQMDVRRHGSLNPHGNAISRTSGVITERISRRERSRTCLPRNSRNS